MNTPICDFVRRYADGNSLRLHMPGHKGRGPLGIEALDLTEIDGADSLYEADGIIRESEENAGMLFGCRTFYSCEGSSLSIRAMLYLVCLHAKESGQVPLVWAGRNAHKTFLSAAALLDFEVEWLTPTPAASYLSCPVHPEALEQRFLQTDRLPTAVYLTSPDYLGNTVDVAAISAVCHRHGVLCLIDNAHGAYLKFLQESRHPIDLGADLCCDSAHKTLPVLTGGAYLHVSPALPASYAAHAKQALMLFGSTSPSYLILQSLDAANRYLADGYPEKLDGFLQKLDSLKTRLSVHGYRLTAEEPLKLTIAAKAYGYTGQELAACLAERDMICEFADPDYLVLMLTPELGTDGLTRLEQVLCAIPQRPAIAEPPPVFHLPEQALSIREALFSPSEWIPAKESAGRILAAATVGCPPAVPIVVSGERIGKSDVLCFSYYGVEFCQVVKE